MKSSEKLYLKYEYLAKKYAANIFAYEELSFEFEDLIQEFRLKIFTSIKAYGRRWAKYRKGQASRPVPIKYYIECACSNKSRDFMKFIGRENHKIRIDDISYDYGVEDDNHVISEKNKFIVRGVDLLENLTGKERAVFSLYLRGYNLNFLNKVYYSTKQEKIAKQEIINNDDNPFTPADIIEFQKEYLIQKYGDELLSERKLYKSYSMED